MAGGKPTRKLTRRQMIGRGGMAAGGVVGLGLAGLVGFELPHDQDSASASSSPASAQNASAAAGYNPDALIRSYVTRPDLQPPAISVTDVGPDQPATTPKYLLVSPKGYPGSGSEIGQPGNIILDRQGRIVWFRPSVDYVSFGFNAQVYQGQPVLTWWEGEVYEGHGRGEAVIADASYQIIQRIQAANGLKADLHEFVVTPQNTALITTYRRTPADLSALGGRVKGYIWAGIAQEIDIETGRLLFEWDSSKHVDVRETMVKFADGSHQVPFDYFHINSIAVMPDGDLMIGSRDTCALYKVERPSGKVVWRLGGKQSSFTMGSGSRFYYQHHSRPHGSDLVSLFDDGGSPRVEKQSRGVLLNVDTRAMKVTLRQEYKHPAGVAAANQGSMQLLPDGRVLIGWGNEPYFSEFAPDGSMRLDGEFPPGDQSYRAFTAGWHGRPPGRPAAAARVNPAGGTVVYASWNGATDVAGWRVHGGTTPGLMSHAGEQEWLGFETAIVVASKGPYFSVTPYDADGHALTSSETVKVKHA